MAHPAGLEPATPRFEAWYSIQLNYRCAERVTTHASAECCTSLRPHASMLQTLLRMLLTSQQLSGHGTAMFIIRQQNLAVHHGV